MVAEIGEGILRPQAGEELPAVTRALSSLVLSIFDVYPFPAELSKAEWLEARRQLAQRLDLVGTSAVQLPADIPKSFVDNYVAVMPSHEKLRGHDHQTIRNYLRVTTSTSMRSSTSARMFRRWSTLCARLPRCPDAGLPTWLKND
jgi:hypothetical protein